MKVEKKQEAAAQIVKRAARIAMKVEKKQEGPVQIEKKAATKGITGSRRLLKTASGSCGSGGAAPVAASKFQKLAEGDKADAGKGKRLVRVSQKYIDILLKEKATGTGMYRKNRSQEIVDKYKGSLDLRGFVAISNSIREKIHADDAKILEQYHRFGYAYAEVEEDEEESEVCGPLTRSKTLASSS